MFKRKPTLVSRINTDLKTLYACLCDHIFTCYAMRLGVFPDTEMWIIFSKNHHIDSILIFRNINVQKPYSDHVNIQKCPTYKCSYSQKHWWNNDCGTAKIRVKF